MGSVNNAIVAQLRTMRTITMRSNHGHSTTAMHALRGWASRSSTIHAFLAYFSGCRVAAAFWTTFMKSS